MLEFRDFVPQMTDKGGFFRMPTMQQLSQALREANAWIAQNQVNVINIETVVLPNIHSPGEEGSQDVLLTTSGEMSAHWCQLIRVWYRQ